MKYIKGYDGLRAASILMVLITHLGAFFMLPDSAYLKNHVWPLFAGTTGVVIFFVLSGFLITRILLTEYHKFHKINFKRFFARRFLRLLPPLILFYLLVIILIILKQIKPSYTAVLLSFFYLYNFVPYKYYFTELGHTWSLAVEEQFYIFWPFLISKLSIRRLLQFGLITVVVSMIVLFVFKYGVILHNGSKYSVYSFFYAERFIIPAIAPIMIGSIFSIYYFFDFQNIRRKLSSNTALFLCLSLYASPLILPIILTPVFNIIQALGIAILLVWICTNQESLIVKTLEFRPVSFIGKISYGIYVYQGLFLTTGPQKNGAWFQSYPKNIILALTTAIASYYFWEKPILKLKDKFFSLKR